MTAFRLKLLDIHIYISTIDVLISSIRTREKKLWTYICDFIFLGAYDLMLFTFQTRIYIYIFIYICRLSKSSLMLLRLQPTSMYLCAAINICSIYKNKILWNLYFWPALRDDGTSYTLFLSTFNIFHENSLILI